MIFDAIGPDSRQSCSEPVKAAGSSYLFKLGSGWYHPLLQSDLQGGDPDAEYPRPASVDFPFLGVFNGTDAGKWGLCSANARSMPVL